MRFSWPHLRKPSEMHPSGFRCFAVHGCPKMDASNTASSALSGSQGSIQEENLTGSTGVHQNVQSQLPTPGGHRLQHAVRRHHWKRNPRSIVPATRSRRMDSQSTHPTRSPPVHTADLGVQRHVQLVLRRRQKHTGRTRKTQPVQKETKAD